MMKKVEKFITDNEIFKHGDSVVLGVSGGADSTCLLYVLNDLKEKLDLKLLVVHVNHGIRGEEADRDAMHVKKMCEKLNVPFRLKEVNVPSISKETGKSEEEAGRDARYALHQPFLNGGSTVRSIFFTGYNFPAGFFQLPVNLLPRSFFRKHGAPPLVLRWDYSCCAILFLRSSSFSPL